MAGLGPSQQPPEWIARRMGRSQAGWSGRMGTVDQQVMCVLGEGRARGARHVVLAMGLLSGWS